MYSIARQKCTNSEVSEGDDEDKIKNDAIEKLGTNDG